MSVQFADGVYLVLLMGLLEGYFVPLHNFYLTPDSFDQKVCTGAQTHWGPAACKGPLPAAFTPWHGRQEVRHWRLWQVKHVKHRVDAAPSSGPVCFCVSVVRCALPAPCPSPLLSLQRRQLPAVALVLRSLFPSLAGGTEHICDCIQLSQRPWRLHMVVPRSRELILRSV